MDTTPPTMLYYTVTVLHTIYLILSILLKQFGAYPIVVQFGVTQNMCEKQVQARVSLFFTQRTFVFYIFVLNFFFFFYVHSYTERKQ